ncbi:MAG TPA: VWA domain-containing protein [Thermoanaerobaculia bacterium]|nr:VWA domain-containing protein [Thermoanaerobaculia bacterium]
MQGRGFMLLLSIASALPALAQSPAIPHAGESIEVSIVNIDTVVTDKHGNRVRGLGKDDFEIYENGVRQPVTNFAEYGTEAKASSVGTMTSPAGTAQGAPRTPLLPPPAQPRTIIVFVERFQLPSFRSDPVFAAMKKLLHETVRKGDRVMVVTWNRGILGMRQEFTDDLVRIDKAIEMIADRTTTLNHDPIADLEQEVDSIQAFEEESAVVNGGRISSSDIANESGLSFFVEQMARFTAKDALLDEKRKVETLNALMRSAGGTEGKKVLILATHRLSMFAGAEALFAAGATVLPSDFKNQFDGKQLIKSLIETANQNGFTIYPIYAEGLATTSGATSELRARQNKVIGYEYLVLNNETPMLEYVAKETGGAAAWGSNDVTKLIPSVGEDLDSYYSLAYRATSGKAAARKIEVKVKDPKLVVRARTQYLPKSDTARMDERVIATLFGNQPPASFEVKVRLAQPKLDEQKHYIIPVTIEVPISALTTLPAAGNVHNGAFTVYMAWGAVFGGLSEPHRDTKQFSIADADLARAKGNYFTYQVGVASATPYLRIALGVYDEVSKDYALNLIDLPPPVKRQ